MANGPGVAASGSGTVQEAQAIDSPEEQRRRRLAQARAERELQQQGMTESTARVVGRTQPDRSQPRTEATIDAAPGLRIGGPRQSTPQTISTIDDPRGNTRERSLRARVEAAEQEAERGEASIGIPDAVPVVGGAEVEFGGQAREVEPRITEETVEGPEGQEQTTRRAEFEEQARFGDFGFRVPDAVPVVGGVEPEAVARDIQEGVVSEVSRFELVGGPGTTIGLERREPDEPPSGALDAARSGAAEGAFGFATGIPIFIQEGLEFGFEGIEETAAGRGGEFAGEATDAAIGRAAELTSQFQRDPTRTGGILAGSVLVSGGAIGGASRLVGPRAGRATSVAVQPGEELAIAAGSRLPAVRRAVTRIPGTGVRAGHFEGDVDGPGVAGRVRGAAGELRARAPRVEVTRDPDAPLVDVSGNLRRDVVSGIQRRVSQPVESTSERLRRLPDEVAGTVQGAQLSGEAAVTFLGRAARDFPGGVRRRVPDTDVRAEAAGVLRGAQLSTEAAMTNLRRAAGDVDVSPPRSPGDVRRQMAGTAQGAQLSFEAGMTNLQRRLANIDRPSTGGFELRDRVSGTMLGAQLTTEAAATNLARWLANIDVRSRLFPDVDVRDRVSGTAQGAQLSFEAGATNLQRRLRGLEGPSLEGLSDLSIRVGPGRPGPREFELDLDEDDVGIQFDDDAFGMDIPTRGEGAGPGAQRGEPDIPAAGETGGGSGTVQQMGPRGSRTEAEPAGVGEEFDVSRRRAPQPEPSFDDFGDALSEPLDVSTEAAGVGPELDQFDAIDVDLGGRLDAAERQVPETVEAVDPVELLEPRSDTRTESRSEMRTELRTEARTEPRTELRTELRSEPRTEIDLPGDFPELDPDRPRRRGFGLFTREFRNPVGEPEEALDVVIGDELDDIDSDLGVDV